MKLCSKCKTEKPLEQFYKHSQMADGHLGKCIECTKRDVAELETKKRQDPEWLSKERQRCRMKTAKARASGTQMKTTPETRARWQAKNPQKRKAQIMAANARRSGKIQKKTACEKCS